MLLFEDERGNLRDVAFWLLVLDSIVVEFGGKLAKGSIHGKNDT